MLSTHVNLNNHKLSKFSSFSLLPWLCAPLAFCANANKCASDSSIWILYVFPRYYAKENTGPTMKILNEAFSNLIHIQRGREAHRYPTSARMLQFTSILDDANQPNQQNEITWKCLCDCTMYMQWACCLHSVVTAATATVVVVVVVTFFLIQSFGRTVGCSSTPILSEAVVSIAGVGVCSERNNFLNFVVHWRCVAFPNVFAHIQNRQQIFLYNKIVFILLYKVHTGTAGTTLTQYALSIRIYYYLSLCHA